MNARRISTLLVSCAVASSLAACANGHPAAAKKGLNKPTGPSSTRSTGSGLPAGMTTLPPSRPDSVRTSDMVVRLSDLPAGWSPMKNSTSPAQQLAQDSFFDHCLGIPVIEGVTTKIAYSQFKDHGGVAFVYSSAAAFKKAVDAEAEGAALRGAKVVSCNIATERKYTAAPPGGKVGAITGTVLPLPRGEFGDRIVTQLTLKNGVKFLYYADQIGIVAGRFVVQLEFDSAVSPPNGALEAKVAKAVFLRSLAAAV